MVSSKKSDTAGGTSKAYLEYRSEMNMAIDEMLSVCFELDLSYRKEMTKLIHAWLEKHRGMVPRETSSKRAASADAAPHGLHRLKEPDGKPEQ